MCQQLWCQSQRYYIVGLRGLHSPARLLLMPIRFVLCCYGNRCCSESTPFVFRRVCLPNSPPASCRQLVRYEILSHRSVYQRYASASKVDFIQKPFRLPDVFPRQANSLLHCVLSPIIVLYYTILLGSFFLQCLCSSTILSQNGL